MLDALRGDAEYRGDPFEPPLDRARSAIREHWNGVAAEQADVEFDAERVWVSGRDRAGQLACGLHASQDDR